MFNEYPFIKSIQQRAMSGGVIAFIVDYEQAHYSDTLYSEFSITQPENIQKSVVKRKSDYLAGRLAARLCLEALSMPGFSIETGEHRAPVWPQGIIGSITHTQAKAVAMAAKPIESLVVGVDVEEWLTDKTTSTVKDMVLNARETQMAAELSISFNHFLTLAFSVKESLFKALYPQVKAYFDFSDATITVCNEEKQEVEIALNRDLGPYRQGDTFISQYETSPQDVLTFIIQ